MKDASICGCGEKKYWKYANCNRCYHLKINETLVRRRISECLGDEAVESTRIVNLWPLKIDPVLNKLDDDGETL